MTQLVRFSPALLGVLIVLQAGLNRRIASQWGIATATLINGCVIIVTSLAIWSFCVWRPESVPAAFRLPQTAASLRSLWPWFVVPGLCGITLVVGTPWAIAQWGAAHTVVLVVSAQLMSAALWDYFAEGIPLSSSRAIGIVFAWAGVVIASGVFAKR